MHRPEETPSTRQIFTNCSLHKTLPNIYLVSFCTEQLPCFCCFCLLADQRNSRIVSEASRKPLYPTCDAHSDCGENQFCGVKCWTGGCGADGDVSSSSKGRFCQPCGKCQSALRSVTRTCIICDSAGNQCDFVCMCGVI